MGEANLKAEIGGERGAGETESAPRLFSYRAAVTGSVMLNEIAPEYDGG
jgi:myosin heavy subunit